MRPLFPISPLVTSPSSLRVSPASLPLVSTSGCSQTLSRPDPTSPRSQLQQLLCSWPHSPPPRPQQSHATPCCNPGLISDDCIELGLSEGSHLLTSAFLSQLLLFGPWPHHHNSRCPSLISTCGTVVPCLLLFTPTCQDPYWPK